MPRLKRWFHVSHDINEDAEVWELTDRFGERALRVWLEILSIADRNQGVVPGMRDTPQTCFRDASEYIARSLSGKCHVSKRTVLCILEFAQSKLWLSSDMPLRVSNYAKYNPTRDVKEIPSGILTVPPPLHSTPTTPKEEEISLSRARESSPSEMEKPELQYEPDPEPGPEPDLVEENQGPEIALYVQITGIHPPFVNYDRIRAALKGKKAAEVLPFFEEWCARGFKPFNMGWLDWVRASAIPSRNGARAGPSPPVAHTAPCPECKNKDPVQREAHWQKYEDEDALKQHFYETLPAEQAQQRYAELIKPWRNRKKHLTEDRERAERTGHLHKPP